MSDSATPPLDFSSWIHPCCSGEGHQWLGFAESNGQVSVLPLPPPPPESGTAGNSLSSDTFFTWLHSTVSWFSFSLSGGSISLLCWFLLHFLTSKHWSDPGLTQFQCARKLWLTELGFMAQDHSWCCSPGVSQGLTGLEDPLPRSWTWLLTEGFCLLPCWNKVLHAEEKLASSRGHTNEQERLRWLPQLL